MTFRIDNEEPATFVQACSCGEYSHGIAVYVDRDDGTVAIYDQYLRPGDALDLRGLWDRIRAAAYVLAGRRHGYACVILHAPALREFARLLSQSADAHDRWRGVP